MISISNDLMRLFGGLEVSYGDRYVMNIHGLEKLLNHPTFCKIRNDYP